MKRIEENDFSHYFRREPILEINEYTKPAHRHDLEALAQNIQNLLLIEKGTYPNDPEFGVGLAEYIFEFADNITINDLRAEIEEQISKYIFYRNTSVSSTIDFIDLPAKNAQALKITITMYPNERTALNNTFTQGVTLKMLFAGNKHNGKIVSKLIN